MKIFMIGLGKMGHNLVLNMKEKGFDVVGYDNSEVAINKAKDAGIDVYSDFDEFININSDCRVFWVMLPSGNITNNMLNLLKNKLRENDIVIDGGNSDYNDSLEHAKDFEEKGMYFFDTGTSGGVSGARNGCCLLVGGNQEIFEKYLEKLYDAITLEDGYMYTGKSGSGHYMKMIHNAILYGMMQTIGEGFELLHASEFDYDLEKVAKTWNASAVIRGWLMELAGNAFSKDKKLDEIDGIVNASKEAQVTLNSGFKYGAPTPVIALSLYMRMKSKQESSFSSKVIAALRNEVGGHDILKKK